MNRILRVISLLMVMVLIATSGYFAAGTSASSVSEIEQQIRRVYQKAREYQGRDSFHGYCGGLVNSELHFLGITDTVVGNNGNEEYDYYSKQTITSGGFRVRAYSPSRYTLEEALNAITENGTKDAYNILVGFQATRSAAGSRYGHAVVIHAILNGTVYYMESYDVNLNGKRYPEGSPISCSISDFAAYYKRTTVSLDGVIYFGKKSYSDLCRVYPSYLTVSADGGAVVRTQPCEAKTDGGSEHIRTLSEGEELTVTGLYLNTEGEYWYQIHNGKGFVKANRTRVVQFLYDDMAVSKTSAPEMLRQGKSFNIKGTVTAQYNEIQTLRAQVVHTDGETEIQATGAIQTVEGREYNLKNSQISKDLTFRRLETGNYRYDLVAVAGNHYYDRGQLQIDWKTVLLWSSDFQVVKGSTAGNILSFDPCGGSVATNQTIVTDGEAVGALPVPELEGSVFLGWYTEDGERLKEEYVPQEDMTLSAQWITEQELYENWQNLGECIYFYSDGLTTTGCIEMEGVLYYFSSVDAVGQNWTVWTVA